MNLCHTSASAFHSSFVLAGSERHCSPMILEMSGFGRPGFWATTEACWCCRYSMNAEQVISGFGGVISSAEESRTISWSWDFGVWLAKTELIGTFGCIRTGWRCFARASLFCHIGRGPLLCQIFRIGAIAGDRISRIKHRFSALGV
jgi:hypothetical protein